MSSSRGLTKLSKGNEAWVPEQIGRESNGKKDLRWMDKFSASQYTDNNVETKISDILF